MHDLPLWHLAHPALAILNTEHQSLHWQQIRRSLFSLLSEPASGQLIYIVKAYNSTDTCFSY